MRINFIFLPFLGRTGGLKVILEYANHLQLLGHQVKFISPRRYLLRSKGKELIRPYLRLFKDKFLKCVKRKRIDWFPVQVEFLRVPTPEAKYIPNADISIAGDSEIADWLVNYPPTKGVKFYLVQGYETWYRDKKAVDQTLRDERIKKITISKRMENILREMGVKPEATILNAVDPKEFYNPLKIYHSTPTILMLNHYLKIKGVEDGLKALKIVKDNYSAIKIRMFGLYPKRKDFLIGTEYFYNPPTNRMRELYCTSDIFLSPSWGGVGLPVLEAMACKTAVVTTTVENGDGYIRPEKDALVAPIKRPYILAKQIFRLIKDRQKLMEISLTGYKRVKNLSWTKSAKEMEKVFIKAISQTLLK